jgi:hypothetical protein
MAKKPSVRDALQFISARKVVLTFPESNHHDPASLWTCFHPRKKMRWEWDSQGDASVADLWIFREQLSRSGRTAYAKWYRGKATFIDREFLPYLLSALGIQDSENRSLNALSRTARQILETLQENSPLSTKELKKIVGLRGRDFEAEYHRALRELWTRLWIVGWGEKDDGAFPSLNMASTRLMFENEWKVARELNPQLARQRVLEDLEGQDSVRRFTERLFSKIATF